MSDSNKGSEKGLFQAALDQAVDTDRGYLGDADVVESMLREFVNDCVQLSTSDTPDEYVSKVHKLSHDVAREFLGTTQSNHLVPGWNQPGGIDEHLAKWAGVDEQDPEVRVSGALLRMLADFSDIAAYAMKPDTLEEQVRFQIDGMFQHFTGLFIGLTPAQLND